MIDLLNIMMRNALALSFDDSLSPTELMGAVVAKVNEMAAALNGYLSTDISSVINAKLEEWEGDGTMADLIESVIVTEVTDARSSAVKSIDYDTLDARLEALESDVRAQMVDVVLFGAVGDAITDDTVAIQAAIDYCIANECDLSVSRLCKITASLMIDREVDNTDFDHYFTIFSINGGGFYVSTPINLFSSNYAYTTAPVSQMIKFRGLRFVASANTVAAYVLHNSRYLRTVFEGCTFSKIKCLYSETYTQSIYFNNCNVRRISGTFFLAPMNYDLQVIGGLYESIAGNCFDIKVPVGCKINCMIEGVSGTALLINGAQGIDICGYFEANGLDIDSRTGGAISWGIHIHGSYFSHSADATYTVKWGSCQGCSSIGNFHNNNMHDLQADSVVEINDMAQTNLCNFGSGFVMPHIGYRENPENVLVVRSDNSADYTVSDLVCRNTVIGNRIHLEFKLKLTSTGTNAAGDLYIPSLFPIDAVDAGMLCGMVEVIGTGLANDGISPLYIASASPLQIQSSQNVIPENTATDSWTVRGFISYQAVPIEMPA